MQICSKAQDSFQNLQMTYLRLKERDLYLIPTAEVPFTISIVMRFYQKINPRFYYLILTPLWF